MNADRKNAQEMIQRIRKDLNQYNASPEKRFDILFSDGVVQFDPSVHKNIDDLIDAGDSLMYQMKKNKANK